MNKDWSEKNKRMQALISKKDSFNEGINLLLELRAELFERIEEIFTQYKPEDFSKMPYPNAQGYHNKTLAYSIWHIFRIEDIVANALVKDMEEVLTSLEYNEKTGADITTTGNELTKEEIVEFSGKLDLKALLDYAKDVMETTDELIKSLKFRDLKRKFTEADKEKLLESGSVSHDENAVWLVDYWCSKNLLGLIKMPFSRHWIMHIEAMNRIAAKL